MSEKLTALDHEKIAGHFDFIAKMLRGARTVRVINPDGTKGKPVATWKAAAEEAEYAAKAIRAALSKGGTDG